MRTRKETERINWKLLILKGKDSKQKNEWIQHSERFLIREMAVLAANTIYKGKKVHIEGVRVKFEQIQR